MSILVSGGVIEKKQKNKPPAKLFVVLSTDSNLDVRKKIITLSTAALLKTKLIFYLPSTFLDIRLNC